MNSNVEIMYYLGLIWLIASGTMVTSLVPTGESIYTLFLKNITTKHTQYDTPTGDSRMAYGIHIRSADLKL